LASTDSSSRDAAGETMRVSLLVIVIARSSGLSVSVGSNGLALREVFGARKAPGILNERDGITKRSLPSGSAYV